MKNQIYFQYDFLLFSNYHTIIVLFIITLIKPLCLFSNSNFIHEVLVNGVSTDVLNNSIELTTSDNVSIILPRISDSLNYKYQCKGRDSFFVIESLSVINLTNLPEGVFQFRANTSNRSEDEINKQSPLIIEVHHSYLDSWNFTQMLLIYILLLFGGAGYFIILSNQRSKLKLIDLRNDWTNKLHNDIGADLSSVSLHINTLNRRLGDLHPTLKGKVEKVHTILNSIQNKLRFVFDLVDPKKDSLQVMLSEIEHFAIENLALKQINLKFENNLEIGNNHELNIGQINKVYFIMKEAINNAVKHSNAANAFIEIAKIKEGISISIEDDGVGFDPSMEYDGNGVDNLIEYGREGFIDVQINSSRNKGTEIKILVPKL